MAALQRGLKYAQCIKRIPLGCMAWKDMARMGCRQMCYLTLLQTRNLSRRNCLLQHHRKNSSFAGAPSSTTIGVLNALEYERVSDDTLEDLAERFDELGEQEATGEDYDAQYSSGVLTVRLGGGKGTYVINKQTPNKQIWLSSPTSGPKRYDFIDGAWIYRHDGCTLHCLLSNEISTVTGVDVNFTTCKYGSKSC